MHRTDGQLRERWCLPKDVEIFEPKNNDRRNRNQSTEWINVEFTCWITFTRIKWIAMPITPIIVRLCRLCAITILVHSPLRNTRWREAHARRDSVIIGIKSNLSRRQMDLLVQHTRVARNLASSASAPCSNCCYLHFLCLRACPFHCFVDVRPGTGGRRNVIAQAPCS